MIMIIIQYYLGLDRNISTLSNSLDEGLQKLFRLFGVYLSSIFVILLLFVPLTRTGQFDLYHFIFSKNISIISSFNIS
jgi:hypothetical protein